MGAEQSRLTEKYHVSKVKLGEGSFGVVYRATDKSKTHDNVVAIKCCEFLIKIKFDC